MAKIVIAGKSDCPYYAKVELLADQLAKQLDHFNVHKVVIQENDWESWLQNTCNERGWLHRRSPVIWRELIDRGGKGVLIGGANDFQEYVYGYYNVKSDMLSEKMAAISEENKSSKVERDEEDEYYKSLSHPVAVCVTGASSPSAYHLIPDLVSGRCLGENTEINLTLLDTPDTAEALAGVKMEVEDLAFPLCRKVTVTHDPQVAFTDCVAVIVLDYLPQKEDESRDHWLLRNSERHVEYGKALNAVARRDVKVVVCGGGPGNFNAFMMQENAPEIGRENIVAMSRLTENRAKALLSKRLSVNSASVVDVVVWGNPEGRHFLDVTRSRVHRYDGAIWGPPEFSLPATEMIADDKWLETEFLTHLSEHAQAVENAMKHRAAMSRASAAVSLLRHWCLGAPQGQIFSLGVYSDGSHYDIPEGLVYSFPVTFTLGKWQICEEIELSDSTKEQISTTVQDLLSEKYATFPHLKPASPEPAAPPEDSLTTDGSYPKVFGSEAGAEQNSEESLAGGEHTEEGTGSARGLGARSSQFGEDRRGSGGRRGSSPGEGVHERVDSGGAEQQ